MQWPNLYLKQTIHWLKQSFRKVKTHWYERYEYWWIVSIMVFNMSTSYRTGSLHFIHCTIYHTAHNSASPLNNNTRLPDISLNSQNYLSKSTVQLHSPAYGTVQSPNTPPTHEPLEHMASSLTWLHAQWWWMLTEMLKNYAKCCANNKRVTVQEKRMLYQRNHTKEDCPFRIANDTCQQLNG